MLLKLFGGLLKCLLLFVEFLLALLLGVLKALLRSLASTGLVQGALKVNEGDGATGALLGFCADKAAYNKAQSEKAIAKLRFIWFSSSGATGSVGVAHAQLTLKQSG